MKTTSSSFGSEDNWTSRLKDILSSRSDVVTGIGDDAAVVRMPGGSANLVYTTDAVVEGIHFTRGTEPGRIGHKIVGRLLSDLAAMGAEPDHILLNLVVAPGHSEKELEKIYAGAEALAVSFGASIVGGDTIRGDVLSLHGFASGHVPENTATLRSGTRAGDRIYVTGELGGSIAGKHLDFTPRVREGIWLREGGWVTAMMDLSDGVARDLPRLCYQSSVGARVIAASVPTNTNLEKALCDGEDYELLFTVPADKAEAFDFAWKRFANVSCTCIGEITSVANVVSVQLENGDEIPMPDSGFDHLSNG